MTLAPLPRDLLQEALGNPRLVRAFEAQAQAIVEAQVQSAANVEATEALQDATFVTLSPNATLQGERVLKVGAGIRIAVTADEVVLSVTDEVPHVQGGFAVDLVAQGPATLVLPLTGFLATRDGTETLGGKTLLRPRLSGLVDAADDAAAAAADVPIGGAYRTGSALKVRVA